MRILTFSILLIQILCLVSCENSKVGDAYGLSDLKTPVISFSGATGTSFVENGTTTVTPTSLDDRDSPITNCISSPALPAGLTIDPTTCVITGSASTVTGPVNYTIQATNAFGTGEGNLSINVFAGYLLDKHPNATVAYGLRKLKYGYSGPCIRIIRSSDSQETDIGFVGAALDTVAITNFVGGADGRVVYWYDQSGNGIDLVSDPARRYYIALGGALSYEGGDLVLNSNGDFKGFKFQSNIGILPDWTVYAKAKAISLYSTYVSQNGSFSGLMQHGGVGGFGFHDGGYNSIGNYNTHYLKIQASRLASATTVYGYENGVASGSATSVSDFNLGTSSWVFGEFAGGGYEGSVRELVIYPTTHIPATILEINNLM